ncbi:MAG: hypothetical protein Faunusvirus1_49 [Faunusvirus sp.]|jgi:hypothetical protein|uniref:Uncharacterized protein n=1 Tax=Faunusvirus sp. TaxID=2487766 RepID=A0A3G5A0D3_9VIRU|nr:MAG: hypothetical protein Faunusvirus1_49 [Faunusvirus sp.]
MADQTTPLCNIVKNDNALGMPKALASASVVGDNTAYVTALAAVDSAMKVYDSVATDCLLKEIDAQKNVFSALSVALDVKPTTTVALAPAVVTTVETVVENKEPERPPRIFYRSEPFNARTNKIKRFIAVAFTQNCETNVVKYGAAIFHRSYDTEVFNKHDLRKTAVGRFHRSPLTFTVDKLYTSYTELCDIIRHQIHRDGVSSINRAGVSSLNSKSKSIGQKLVVAEQSINLLKSIGTRNGPTAEELIELHATGSLDMLLEELTEAHADLRKLSDTLKHAYPAAVKTPELVG